MEIGKTIADRRKARGLTQQMLAERLDITYQAVSRWENGITCPDIELLPRLAAVLGLSIDALLGYPAQSVTEYDARYKDEAYYWGLAPNRLCYEIMQLRPPTPVLSGAGHRLRRGQGCGLPRTQRLPGHRL